MPEIMPSNLRVACRRNQLRCFAFEIILIKSRLDQVLVDLIEINLNQRVVP
jgi:hypothetical protein